jgi:trigger factor
MQFGGTNMASIMEKKENNVVVLTIDVSKEDFAAAVQQSYQKNKNRFQIPGFRKGKAPYHMVKQYYGEGVFYDDAIDFAVNPAYAAAVKEHDLKVVSKPDLDILDIGADKGLKFSITVTEKPTVTLGTYLGVEAPFHFHDATEEDVQKELDRLAERNSRLVPVEDRAATAGDTVTIDYEGFLKGVAFEGGQAVGYDLTIGSGSFIPGFEEQIVGHQINDEFPITVTFPEEYHSEELKGQEVTFQIAVHAIKAKEFPVIDDEFAKDVSEFDTLAEYRADILSKKMEQAKTHAEADFQNAVVKVVCDLSTVDVPDCMIDSEVEQMLDEQKTKMKYQGIELEQYLQYVGQTIEEFKMGLAPAAKTRVKSMLVIEAISIAEKIVATEEDVDAEAEKIAAQYQMKKEDLLARLGGNDGFIRENIVSQKTVDLLTAAAKKVDFHEHNHEGHDHS